MTSEALWASEARFAPSRTSPAEARAFVDLHLFRHDLAYLIDDVQLVVTELVTNAAIHARTPVRVLIQELPFCVKLTVFDECADLPVLRLQSWSSSDVERGRGLGVVDAFSADWGTDIGPHGKSIWALFGVRPKSSWVH